MLRIQALRLCWAVLVAVCSLQAQIVMLFEQTVEQRFFRGAPHLHELHGLKITQRSAQPDPPPSIRERPCAFRDTISHRAPYARQLDLARAVKQQQQSAAHHVAYPKLLEEARKGP